MNEKRRVSAGVVPAVTLMVAGVLACLSCSRAPEAPPGAAGQSPDTVARIGEYAITRAELEERLVQEIRPREEEYSPVNRPVTAETVLRQMLAEKAMSLEGRRLGYLQDEQIQPAIQQEEHRRLVGLLRDNCLRERLPDPNARAEQARQADPKLTLDQARVLVQRQVLEQFGNELIAKLQLKKLEENFMQAALIHQRLLLRPVEPRGPNEYWIKNSQVRNELSDKEKNLVLATYTGGQFTLKDWFQVVCNIAPPRRPGDLNTPAGVGRLLEGALWTPILVAEAKARGYDKDEKLRRELRQIEDLRLLYKVQEERTKGVVEPPAEQVKAYFEKNQERFAQAATLKISQIWCASREAAQKARAEVDGGADFETVRKAQSLQKEETPHIVSAIGEGLFWDELWKGEPNQVLGPVRGFYGSGVKWRVVKILEKTPPKAQPFTEQLANSVKWALMDEQRQQLLENCRTELLKKYPPEIFRDRIKDLDPLEVALRRGD
jgi:hypothetical protein